MVKESPKPSPSVLPSLWHRGPSGLVEEWETRVSEEEIERRQGRWRYLPHPTDPALDSTKPSR